MASAITKGIPSVTPNSDVKSEAVKVLIFPFGFKTIFLLSSMISLLAIGFPLRSGRLK